MDQNQLVALKKRIVNDIVPLALNSENSSDRFELLLRVIQAGGANGEMYSKAYESAKQIQDKDQQLNSLLALLDELDLDTQLATSEDANLSPSDTSSSEFSAPTGQSQG
jgi:hypothetical protein